MRTQLVTICAVLLAAGCGVNPDRLATMHERSAERAERATKSAQSGTDEEAPLEYDDNDPAAVRDAIMALQDLSKLVAEKKFEPYLTKRYELMRTVSYEASEAVATSPKTPLIIDRVHGLDGKVAATAGGDAKANFETTGRAEIASADALYSLKEALEACDKAVEAPTEAARGEAWTKYKTALERAKAVDAKSMQFVGKRVSGSGYIDVPAEYAVCEARMAVARAEAADRPVAEASMAKTIQGCGFYAVDVEAKQSGVNRFGDYLITSAYVADVDPGTAQAIDCSAIPPVSDAEAAVQTVVQEFVAWLKPTDVVSMAGTFQYSGPEGQKLKKGVVRVYRRDATLKTNACGADGDGVTCEAEGSTLAKAHNHAQHYLKRAEHHKTANDVERCDAMLEASVKAASVASPEAADAKFKVAGNQQLSRAEIQAKVDGFKKQAQDALTNNWCAAK